MMKFLVTSALVIGGALLASSCSVSKPDHVEPVGSFEKKKYLGTWYEIARLENRFEKGMSKVTAEYSELPDGGIKVLNKGYLAGADTWKEAEGKAYFLGKEDEAALKVSFFGPFYGAYIVYDLQEGKEQYTVAHIASSTKKYLWLLARTPDLPAAEIERFKKKAQAMGYDLGNLVLVEHSGVIDSNLPKL